MVIPVTSSSVSMDLMVGSQFKWSVNVEHFSMLNWEVVNSHGETPESEVKTFLKLFNFRDWQAFCDLTGPIPDPVPCGE